MLFALQGAHRVARGAEVAFESVAEHLARAGDHVTVVGGGPPRPGCSYEYIQVAHRPRERFERIPSFPPVRTDIHWEQLAFASKLRSSHLPDDIDVTVACDFPFVHWRLRGMGRLGDLGRYGRRRPGPSGPRHVYVTQNGDWPAQSSRSEFRFFDCDGLVCTNPQYFERNRDHYRAALIPNGVDTERFSPGEPERARFGLPEDAPVALVVAALTPYKRVPDVIEAVAQVPAAHLVVAGDGPQRDAVDELAAARLSGRYHRFNVAAETMPALYRSADALVHLARDEPFGNVYIEALATGLAVVAHDSPTTQWILANDGLLVDGDDRAAVVAAIEKALASSVASGTDSDAVAERVRRCRQRFGWPTVAAAYRSFLREVVDG